MGIAGRGPKVAQSRRRFYTDIAPVFVAVLPLVCPMAALAAVLQPRVLSTNGDEIEAERYIAVVRERSTWKEPLAEALVQPGETPPAWDLTPGTYRVVCSASGFWWDHKTRVVLAPGESHTAECRLVPMVLRSGRIRSSDTGEPIRGAKVGHLHGFLDRFSLQLSPLGEHHSKPQRTALSNGDGVFRLLGPVGHRLPLWVEAEGYTPRFLKSVGFSKEPAEPVDVSLTRGASLAATARVRSFGGSPGYALTLVREDGEGTDPLPAEAIAMTDRLWERVFSAGEKVSWPSLPAGRYRMWLRPVGSEPMNLLPMKAAAVDLAPGDRGLVDIDATEWALAAPEKLTARDLDLGILVRGGRMTGEKFDVIRSWKDDVESFSAAAESVSAGLYVRSPGSCRQGATYVLAGRHSVSLPVSVRDPGSCSELEADLRPASRVKGRLSVPYGKMMPTRVKIGFAGCAQETLLQPDQRLLFPAAVGERGVWEALVPKDCASLTILTEEFAPFSYDETQLADNRAVDLGIADLTEGASVVARITSSLDGRGVPGAEIRLVPDQDALGFVERLFRTKTLGLHPPKIANESGWVRVAGLAAGTYYLHSVAAGEEFGTFSSRPLVLRTGVELFSDAVQIDPPGSLEVLLTGTEFLTKEIEVAEVLATGQANCGWYVGARVSGQLQGDSAFFPELPAGTWQISAIAALDDVEAPLQRLTSFSTQVDPGGHRRVALGLQGNVFRGRVVRGGEPLPAVLDIRPNDQSVAPGRTATDKNGEFTVVLATPGSYAVGVVSRDGATRSVVAAVEFRTAEDEVIIEVPNGRIEGLVLNERNEPVEGARIRAEHVSNPDGMETGYQYLESAAFSKADGSFQLEGLARGPWSLVAKKDDQESQTETLTLGEDGWLGPIRLVVAAREREEARVSTRSGALVAGARLTVSSLPGHPRGLPFAETLVSDSEGRVLFTARRNASGPSNISVEAPGKPVSAMRLELREGSTVWIPEEGGGLELRLHHGDWDRPRLAQLGLVGDHGEFVSLAFPDNKTWSRAEEGESSIFALPALSVGRWRLVHLSTIDAFRQALGGHGLTLPLLADFTILPNSRVSVESEPIIRRSNVVLNQPK